MDEEIKKLVDEWYSTSTITMYDLAENIQKLERDRTRSVITRTLGICCKCRTEILKRI